MKEQKCLVQCNCMVESEDHYLAETKNIPTHLHSQLSDCFETKVRETLLILFRCKVGS